MELGPFSPCHFPLPRGKRHFFYGAKVVEKKDRFPLGRGKCIGENECLRK